MVIEDFRTRAARAGLAHRPEIIVASNAQDFLVGQAADLAPQVECIVIVDIDSNEQAIGGDAEFLGHQPPRKLDRALLEIIAEREIAEHFEKGVVARCIADIVEVVMLAARAHAFLRRHRARIGALLQAGKDVLELHHAGIGEHQGRVIARHERRRGDDLVSLARQIAEKGRSDFIDAGHFGQLSSHTLLSCPGKQRLTRRFDIGPQSI